MLTQLRSWLRIQTSRESRRIQIVRSRPAKTTLSVERLEPREVFDIGPVGSETIVNTTTTGDQRTLPGEPGAVASDAAGNFVVTWNDSGLDGSATGIFAQRFNAAGVAQGDQFQVNVATASTQDSSVVAMDDDGDFVVAWVGRDPGNSDYGIYVRKYNAAGVPQTGEIHVNTYTTLNQLIPSVAMDADGDFVVVWDSFYQDGSSNGVYGQRFDAEGVAVGTEFRVNDQTLGPQGAATVAMDAAGNFVVAWASDFQGKGVIAKYYDANGDVRVPEFVVSTSNTVNGQVFSQVAMDADGDFVVAWRTYTRIFAKSFDELGVAQGEQFEVASSVLNLDNYAAVAMDDDGDYVVTWTQNQGDGDDIYARAYTAESVAKGDAIRVNSTVTGQQRRQSVAMDADGDVVVIWSSFGQDGDGYGVYFQQFTNEYPPTDLTLSNSSVAEDAAIGAVVGVLSATDANENELFTYELTDDAGGRFTVVGNELRLAASLDYESGAAYDVTVRVTDHSGNQYSETFTIAVVDVAPSTPTDEDASPNSVAEGAGAGITVGVDASSADPHGGTVTYSLTNDAGGRFQINATTGVVTTTAVPPDYESSNGSYTITVRAAVGTLNSTQSFIINVTDVAPSAPSDSNGAANEVPVNAAPGTVIGVTASSTDPAGRTVTYSLTSNSGNRFAIDPTTGVVTVAAGGAPILLSDGSYTITVQASGGELTDASDFVVTVIASPDWIVYGTSGDDVIRFYLHDGVYRVKVNGVYTDTYSGTGRIIVYGLEGDDLIKQTYRANNQTIVYGGDDDDRIYGGGVDDILLGGAGDDVIYGRNGRDLIIGGLGDDKVYGDGYRSTRAGEGNILIGDSTAHDDDLPALSAIVAAWGENDASTEATVRSYLSAATAPGDGLEDYIRSAPDGIDWAFSFESGGNTGRKDKIVFGSGDRIN